MAERFIQFGNSGDIFGWDDEDGEPSFMSMDAPGLITDGDVLVAGGGGTTADWAAGLAGFGDVVGPVGATDHAIARYHETTGKIIQDSGVIIDDSDNVTGIADLTVSGSIVASEIGALSGDLKIMPDVQGNVTLFEDTDVGDASSGKMLYVYRKAAEGDDYLRFYIAGGEVAKIDTDTALFIDASGYVKLVAGNHIYLDLGDNAGVQKLHIRDSGKLDVATIDSDGNTVLSGDLAVDTDTLFVDATAHKVGINTTSPSILFDVNEKSGHTSLGGIAVKLTNKTGGSTVAGQLVEVYSATAIDNAFKTAVANSDAVIGITYEAGVADGSEAWIVVSGRAEVLIDAGGCARGDRLISSSTAGSAVVWNTGGAVATHFQEVGHCLETRVGAGLSKIIPHFN